MKTTMHQNTQQILKYLRNLQPVRFTRTGVMCSDLLAENTNRLVVFNTDYSRCISDIDTPASAE